MLSIVEDIASLGLMVVAFALPVLAFAMALALAVVIVVAWRRARGG